MRMLSLLLCLTGLLSAAGNGRLASRHAAKSFALTADPAAAQWQNAPAVFAENGPTGVPTPGHRTEIRSRWTDQALYLLFLCPYEELYLHPDAKTNAETNKLWDWDVAEAFIGSDFQHIRQYKEFQVSPQGEYVDLEIDRDAPKPEGGWLWNSGFKVKARRDESKKIWYGEMEIPWASLGVPQPKAGQELRLNLFRMQGPPPQRKSIAWQPTGAASYHVPEAFGRLVLQDRLMQE